MRPSLWIPLGSFVLAVLLSLFAGPPHSLYARRSPQGQTSDCRHGFIPPVDQHDCVSNTNGVIGSDCGLSFEDPGFYAWKKRLGPEGETENESIYEADTQQDAQANQGAAAPADTLVHQRTRELIRVEGEGPCCHKTTFSGSTFVSLVVSISPVLRNNDFGRVAGSSFANFVPVSDCGAPTDPKFCVVVADLFVSKHRGKHHVLLTGVKGNSDGGLTPLELGPGLGANNPNGFSWSASTSIEGNGGVDFSSTLTWTGVTSITTAKAPDLPHGHAQVDARAHLLKTSVLHDDICMVPE